jgi:Zn ribbon nucleic-acid-binding protein
MLLQCPNCQAVWSMEEIDWQECDACGYPDEEDFEYNSYDDEYETTDF